MSVYGAVTIAIDLSLMEPRNRFQGMNFASLCSLAGRYDDPIPPRFLAPIDFLKIPALAGRSDHPIPPRFLATIDFLKISAQAGQKSIPWAPWKCREA